MATRKITLRQKIYERAGEMLRAGLWTPDYAAFHYAEVTATVRPAYRAWLVLAAERGWYRY